ncbi:MAG: endonuclease/exonuclease/phosphatase family protein [Candidatus Obscuribacterales bacterium]|nr:endonuclease/exonuclease/phosphatase family protein [Candidatus Obscuribacterales bacterium]
MRAKSFFFAALLALLFNVSQLLPFYVPVGGTTDTNLCVMTINVNSRNANFQNVAKVLEESKADVICLQELHPQMSEYLAANLKTYPHQFVVPRIDNFGTGIYSKHPLKDKSSIPIPKRMLPNESFGGPAPQVDILKAVATINGKDITFLDVHPIPPMAEDLSTWRNDGLAKIAELSKAVDGSVIVAGDLNCTRFSPYFGKLLEGGALHDSEEGFGLQPTWPCQIPILSMPIDHVLYKGLLTVSSRVLGPVTGSDHRPVVVSFWYGRLPN